jgi:hypothetical protein
MVGHGTCKKKVASVKYFWGCFAKKKKIRAASARIFFEGCCGMDIPPTAFKYLYKYVSKDHDRATIVVQQATHDGDQDGDLAVPEIDEIIDFINGRSLDSGCKVSTLLSFDCVCIFPDSSCTTFVRTNPLVIF